MTEITCVRCGQEGPQLDKPPFRTEIGQRVHESICRGCWSQWLQQQTALINHYGLDVRDKPARDMLIENMEAFLFGTGEADEIDTSKRGMISW